MSLKTSIKISDSGITFLKKLRLNRIKADTDEDPLFMWESIELIAKYFKNKNDRYLELIKMGNKNV